MEFAIDDLNLEECDLCMMLVGISSSNRSFGVYRMLEAYKQFTRGAWRYVLNLAGAGPSLPEASNIHKMEPRGRN